MKLHVSDSSSVHHQEFFTVHTAVVYFIQVCWQPTRCTNLKFILEWNSTCFGQFLCPSSGVFHCAQQWYMLYRFADNQLDALISNLDLEWNSTCFEQFFCPSSGVFHCAHTSVVYVIQVCWQRTRCTNLKFILEWNSTCFGQFLCPSSGVFHCAHSSGICYTGLLTTN